MLSLNTNIYASESMDSNEYSIIETFSDGSYIKSVLIDDSTDCSSLECTKSEISTTCPASNWKLSEKKHIHLAHQLRQLHRSSSIKKMYIFKQLQELLLLVVINLENYINSKIG